MGTAAEQTVAWLHWEKGNGGSIRHSKRFNFLTEGGTFLRHTPPQPGPLPSDGRGRIVLRRSAYPTLLAGPRDGSGCSLSRRTAYLFSVVAGVLPAVEPGILPGAMGVWSEKSLPLRTIGSGPGGKMPPSTAAKMAAATDVNPTLNTYRTGEGQGEGHFVRPSFAG